jgi:hypothetical protein
LASSEGNDVLDNDELATILIRHPLGLPEIRGPGYKGWLSLTVAPD